MLAVLQLRFKNLNSKRRAHVAIIATNIFLNKNEYFKNYTTLWKAKYRVIACYS